MKNFVVGPAYPYRGGIADFNEALCTAYNNSGTRSEIVSFSMQYPSFLFPGKTQYDHSDPPDLKIHDLINSVNPLSWFRTANFIRQHKPDYIVIRYWLPFMAPALGTIARRVKTGTKTKVIAITDNVIPHEKRPFDRQLTSWFTGSCDGFIAMSRSVMNDLSEFTEKPRVFLPHPVYDIFGKKVSKADAIRHLGLDPGYRYMLFFGFVRNYKGLDILLEALPYIQDKRVKLIIAGEFYEDETRYLEIISRLNLREKVILLKNFIPTTEVKYYFCAADIIVQPYRSATQSGVTQIAYNFGRPMLVSNVGGLAEIVPHNEAGYVVDPDPKAVGDALDDFYRNSREAGFSDAVERLKEKFSWSSFVKGTEDLVTSIRRD